MKAFLLSRGFIAGFSLVYLLEFILSMASIIGGTAEEPTLIFMIENLALGFLTALVGGIVGTRMYGRRKQHLGKAIGFYSFMAFFLIYFGLSLLSSLDSEGGFAEGFLLLIWPALIILGLGCTSHMSMRPPTRTLLVAATNILDRLVVVCYVLPNQIAAEA